MSFHNSTPQKFDSNGTQAGFKEVKQIHVALDRELVDYWVPSTDSTVSQIFPLPSRTDTASAIKKFVKFYTRYRDKRWVKIPIKCDREHDLYTPFVNLINDILKVFRPQPGKPKGKKKKDNTIASRRKVLDTHATPMPHSCEVDTLLKTKPDIGIFGTGPSICSEADIVAPSYGQLLAAVENKLEKTLSESRDRLQLATYAREIFVQQHNRRFVFCILLTEKCIRVYKFDRSGGVYSRWFNIHEEPEAFVRIILGISSLQEESLGYDISIFWDQEPVPSRWLKLNPSHIAKEHSDGRKTLQAVSNVTLMFKIDKNKPQFSRRTIRGRGTTCWLVEDAVDKQQYLVKDCWRAKGRPPESTFLDEALGLDGVGQMHAHQDCVYATSTTLSASSDSNSDSTLARELDRIVFHAYGGDLRTCQTVEELVEAIRDAVVAHLNLLSKGILHRDISLGNVIRGATYSTIKGILIDLDMAKRIDSLVKGERTDGDYRTGTRAFQSIKVLHGKLRHHDHMDDLESIFYLLCWICYGTEHPGADFIDPLPPFLDRWDDINNPEGCAIYKTYFMIRSLPPPSPGFSSIYPLLEALREFFSSRLMMVEKYLTALEASRAPRSEFPEFPPLDLDMAAEDYQKFLAIIDDWSDSHVTPGPTYSQSDALADDAEYSTRIDGWLKKDITRRNDLHTHPNLSANGTNDPTADDDVFLTSSSRHPQIPSHNFHFLTQKNLTTMKQPAATPPQKLPSFTRSPKRKSSARDDGGDNPESPTRNKKPKTSSKLT